MAFVNLVCTTLFNFNNLRARLVEEIKQCCFSVFNIRVGKKVCENMCNVV